MKIGDKTGFSLVEAMILMLVISVSLTGLISVITKKGDNTGNRQAVFMCLNNTTGIEFDSSGNITSLPTSGSCYAAYFGCQEDTEEICPTLFSYADGSGTPDQALSALKILRAACDQGGETACDYFISRCTSNSANCTGPDPKFTLRYYTNLTESVANAGRSLIETNGTKYYSWNMTTFVNEVNTVCPSCPGTTTACKIKGCS